MCSCCTAAFEFALCWSWCMAVKNLSFHPLPGAQIMRSLSLSWCLEEIFIQDTAWLKKGKDVPKKHLPEWWQRGNWLNLTIPWPHQNYFVEMWGEKIRYERISQANKPETKHFWKTCVFGSCQIPYGEARCDGLGHLGYSWFQDQHSHCQGSKGEHVPAFQLSL